VFFSQPISNVNSWSHKVNSFIWQFAPPTKGVKEVGQLQGQDPQIFIAAVIVLRNSRARGPESVFFFGFPDRARRQPAVIL